MRIGFFSETYLPRTDGIAISIETFRQELEALGHEVYIFAPSPAFRYKESSPHIIRFPAFKGLFFDDYLTSLFYPPREIRAIEKLGLDLIHFHTPTQIGLLGAFTALKNDIPLVSTYHADLYEYIKLYPKVLPGALALSLITPLAVSGDRRDFQEALRMMKPERDINVWNQKIAKSMITVVHNRCDVLVAPSEKIRRQLTDWGTRPPIEVVATGVDPIATIAEDPDFIRTEYGLDPSDRIILFVGRLGKEKNVELILNSMPAILEQVPDAKALIVGEHTPGRGQLEELAAKLGIAGRVSFTGHIDHQELGAIYHQATLFAFPSLTDTQGLVLNEAAHAGLPIVMVDPLITEVVEDGKNGLVTAPNKREFAAAIIKILQDEPLRLSMSSTSRKLAAQHTAGKQAAKLLRLYQDVIETHRSQTKKG
jgi:1,2-diacylglycerol 3-alpha-glucosyltransferase